MLVIACQLGVDAELDNVARVSPLFEKDLLVKRAEDPELEKATTSAHAFDTMLASEIELFHLLTESKPFDHAAFLQQL
jgi:hypothetical protein